VGTFCVVGLHSAIVDGTVRDQCLGFGGFPPET
jgi:hypothetical protein